MAQLGQFSLVLALILCGYGMVADIAGAWLGKCDLLKGGRNAFAGCFILLFLAIVVLLIQLIRCDFSISYVVEHTSLDLPLTYRISALWAGAAGSLLFWLWLQTGMLNAAFISIEPSKRLFCAHARIISNLVSIFFLLVLIFDKNPFAHLQNAPADGAGLNPLLRHPAMVLHPPLLFVGYAAFAVPFAWAFARLNATGYGNLFFESIRKWAICAWIFLTAGIVLGAWWAYEELGWGGYWGWDPVENSSLMPWLTATALLHMVQVFRLRTRISTWTEILAILTFSLCIFGTFLTRYGLVSSVHAFGERGLGIIFLLLLFNIWVLAGILLWRRSKTGRIVLEKQFCERIFIWNNWLLVLLAFVTLIGTLFPFLSGLISQRQITLKPQYFTTITSPAALVLVLFIALCPYLCRYGFGKSVRAITSCIAVIICIGLWVVFKKTAIAFLAASGFLICNLVIDLASLAISGRLRWGALGGKSVHLGVALIFIGIAGSGFDIERQIIMTPGQREQIGNYEFVYEMLGAEHRFEFTSMWAEVSVYKQGRQMTKLRPAKAFYSRQEQMLSEVDIQRTLASDIYLALMNVDIEREMINLNIMIKPLVSWIWIGSCLMITGAAVSFFPSKKKM